MIWLAWERVYFRLKIFLFRNSFLWNVKKEEFVLTEQRRIFNTSKRRSYWRTELPSVSLLEVYWKKWSLLKHRELKDCWGFYFLFNFKQKHLRNYANSIDKVKIICFVWNERKNENCQNIQFLCKILKDFRKFQLDRKFMKAECAYTVPRELGSKNVIPLWGFHHTLFSVTLCLLVVIEKLPARAVWRTICWSYLMTTCRSIVTIHFMNCCE
jgi:hypothetical protein